MKKEEKKKKEKPNDSNQIPDLSHYEIPEDYDLFNDENLDMLP